MYFDSPDPRLPKDTIYLGDGLYACLEEGYQIKIFAYNGEEELAAVYLEATALKVFLKYAKTLPIYPKE